MSKYVRKTYGMMVSDSYQRGMSENLYVEVIDENLAQVFNADKDTLYNVHFDEEEILDCDCPHHIYRRVPCKHMFRVSAEIDRTVNR